MDDKEVNASDIGLAMLQGNMVRIEQHNDYTNCKTNVSRKECKRSHSCI